MKKRLVRFGVGVALLSAVALQVAVVQVDSSAEKRETTFVVQCGERHGRVTEHYVCLGNEDVYLGSFEHGKAVWK